MDFSNFFNEDEAKQCSTNLKNNSTKILNTNSNINLEIESNKNISTLQATNGFLTFLPIVDKALNILDDAIKCFSMVEVERQRTLQVKAQSEAIISLSSEKTKQTRIIEKEKTKQLKLQCKIDLEKQSVELQKFKQSIYIELREKEQIHESNMRKLDYLGKSIEEILKTLQLYRERFAECALDKKENLMEQITNCMNNIVILAHDVSAIGGDRHVDF